MIAIEAQGIEQKFQAGAACFIWQDFRGGQPGVIVDGQIQIFPALAALLAAARRALPGAIAGDASRATARSRGRFSRRVDGSGAGLRPA